MKLPYALRNPSDQLLLVGVGSLISGFAAGYIWAKKRYAETIAVAADIIEDLAVDDNQTVLEFEPKTKPKYVSVDLSELTTTDETLNVVVDPGLIQASKDVHPSNYNKISTEGPVEEIAAEPVVQLVKSVFGNIPDEWDYEIEAQNRKPESPYVIHYEEYMADEMGYRQTTVNYYVGDDIMTDDHDVIIYDHAGKLGDLKFGHGSNDPSVVYIRNEALHMEWEVLRSVGHYSHEVLGLTLEAADDRELRHSVTKFRRVE